MFGIPCYLANSAIAEVGYRGDIVKDAATQQMRVVVGQLLLLVKSYPVRLNGLPIGALWYDHGGKYTSLKTTLKSTGGDYPCISILGNDVCLYLVSPLLHPSIGIMYIHTKQRGSAGAVGKMVDCPFSIGGAGAVNNPWGKLTLNINHTPLE